MNQFHALGAGLLMTGVFITLFFYEPGDLEAGIGTLLANQLIPILCIIGGLGLIVYGFATGDRKKRHKGRGKGKKKKRKK